MNALLKISGAALLAAALSVPAAYAQSTVTAPGGNTSGTYMDYMKTVYDRAGAPEITALPLTEFDADFKLNPMGAASWTQSADGLTWTFKLQPNLVWSDGEKLTAEDYVFALQRAAKEGYDFNWYWAFAGGIKGWADVTGDKHADPSTLGIKAVDIYGLFEIIGPGVACECRQVQNGLHGWEDHFLFEVIDPDTMQPKPMGEAGELVITTLTKEALPMIRYRTRDITRLSDEPCACGRSHVRILRVTGRNDDMMIIRGVNVYPSQVEAVLVGFPGIAPHYQIVLSREGALDAMTVEVELAPDFTGDRARKAQEVTHHIKSMIGVTCTVVPKATGEVPRSQGKAVRVVDRRNKAK